MTLTCKIYEKSQSSFIKYMQFDLRVYVYTILFIMLVSIWNFGTFGIGKHHVRPVSPEPSLLVKVLKYI